MTEKRIPIFTFTQRIGNTNFTVRAYCDDDIAVTYEAAGADPQRRVANGCFRKAGSTACRTRGVIPKPRTDFRTGRNVQWHLNELKNCL